MGRVDAAAHADYEANLVAQPVEPLDMAVVIKTIQRLAPEDTVYTNGAGNYSGWLHRYCRYPGLQHHGRTQLAPTSGAMGYGVPAAVAASLLYPQRTVVNIAGDGDFLMTGQELATATRLRREAAHQRSSSTTAPTARSACTRSASTRARVSGTDLFNPDFAALARAYGWRGRVDRRRRSSSRRCSAALESGRPTLLHLKLDADVITSRTTLTAIRRRRGSDALSRQRRAPASSTTPASTTPPPPIRTP